MNELIKRLERVIATGAPDKDGMHPISAEMVLEVVKQLSEHGTDLAEVGTVCIGRQKAIEIVEKYFEKIGLNGDICVDGLRQLPPIQPKRGKWIEGNHANYWKCSECGEITTQSVMGKPRHNFCPNCGADMRGEQDG